MSQDLLQRCAVLFCANNTLSRLCCDVRSHDYVQFQDRVTYCTASAVMYLVML